MSRPRAALVLFAVIVCAALLLCSGVSPEPAQASQVRIDPRLKNAYRFTQDSWTYVHLEGGPAEIGFQHGYLLAPEIQDAVKAVSHMDTHSTKRDWEFFRTTAREVIWPKVEPEYQQELTGIADGLKARGVALDLWDVVALNAMEEVPDYYIPWLNKQQRSSLPSPKAPGNCSAFVATGSYTRHHQVVIAHSNWTNYTVGQRWRVIFDIAPAKGHRILMDGFPGVIVSDDDFGINSDGIMVTETTISGFVGFDPNGTPEFVRARKALQYASSIDDYVRIMNDGNNGGYANDWLLGDRKTGEVARFEQGLKHTRVWRSKDGYFVGSNFASDPELIRDETEGYNPKDLSNSPNARRVRAEQLMEQNKGKIDAAFAERFLADHYDSFDKKEQPSERTLCGHVDVSPRGVDVWGKQPFYPEGAVIGKIADSTMAKQMTLRARAGHPCGGDFKAKPFLAQHPEFVWQEPVLRDMDAGNWSTFKAGQKK